MVAVIFSAPCRRRNSKAACTTSLGRRYGATTEFIRSKPWVVAIISQQSFRWPENPERKQYMKSLYKMLIINEDTTFEILIEFIAFYDHGHHMPANL